MRTFSLFRKYIMVDFVNRVPGIPMKKSIEQNVSLFNATIDSC